MDTLEGLRKKIEGAEDIKSVVKTMKAVAASNIGQYETAVNALGDYFHTIALGVVAYFDAEGIEKVQAKKVQKAKIEKQICAIVFGSDQGLVGSFNDSLSDYVSQSLKGMQGIKEVWAVGERIQLLVSDMGFNVTKSFSVPGSVQAITPLVGEMLIKSQERHGKYPVQEFYIFHNQPKQGSGYLPVVRRLLPLDEKWRQEFAAISWPTKNLPQVAGGFQPTILALIREYLFMSLFKACAESLASENASRLAAMLRAEKNIREMLEDLNNNYHRTRQASIDEELFDVVSGFEALKGDSRQVNPGNNKLTSGISEKDAVLRNE
jgi:F-type H+-transporting ATPase subunit gamma